MSTDQPYDALGRILAEGGEIALGLAILRGWSDSQISTLFARRFSDLSAGERLRLTDMAQAAISGAASDSAVNPTSPIPLANIPVNPELFGDEFSGKRSFFVTEVENPFTGKGIEIRLDFPGIPTLQEINQAMFDEARRRFRESPGKLGNEAGGEAPELTGTILMQERRF